MLLLYTRKIALEEGIFVRTQPVLVLRTFTIKEHFKPDDIVVVLFRFRGNSIMLVKCSMTIGCEGFLREPVSPSGY
jgi:hypothetical protein